MPPAQVILGRTDGSVFGGGVDGGEENAEVPTLTAPPMRARRMASDRNWRRMCPLVAPRARRRPTSLRRSSREMTMMLATPTRKPDCAEAEEEVVPWR